ncbi:gliding motility-associated ABC transporter permease subunit GldF [Pedobacter sp. HMF7647]|uniref:Gliding motility-associated ABC transporter permease subunit GldF n=1 Tax=Hufsiella arboris TaxID=2695275 RepID=A0A7K1YEB7_9SPHI|nr:gliding motility-associated ABC transporter permease subunit GldF [Hufsiella arboris]MXV52935.1 gliding motility-associated ABC transporter permease subunit GldF [Hufsiella arboris]
MLSIFRKEVSSYFNSLVAYITVGIFLAVTGLFLWIFPDTSIFEYGFSSLETLFSIVPYLFMFLIPAITMRSLAEEKKEGTFETLATSPVTDWQIVAGKYLGSVVIVLLALIPTFIYYYTVYELGAVKGNVDTGAVIGSYIGLFLIGSSFSAIGIFASSITKNQIIAFALSVFLCFIAFAGFGAVSKILSFQSIEGTLAGLGIEEHYEAISRGVLDTRDLFYFLSFIAFFLVCTKTVLGGRTW